MSAITFMEWANGGGETLEVRIDLIHLKANLTAANLFRSGLFADM